MARDWSTAITRPTYGARAAVSWPVPQPRSPTTQVSSRSPGSAASSVRWPKSSARSASHCPAELEKNCSDRVRRSASTLRSRSASCSAVTSAATCPRTSCQSRLAPARSLGAGDHPAVIAQDLEVPAYRGLGELEHLAELRDRELVPV